MLFRRLGVFVGGWTLEAAEAVCAGEGVDEGEVLDLLDALLDKSLVRQEAETEGAWRYGMLETIQEYALERLAQSSERAWVARRHAAYVLALAEQAAPYLTGQAQLVWLARLEAERDNLRAALRHYQENGAVEEGLRLVAALVWFVLLRGGVGEHHTWATAFLALPGGTAWPHLRAAALGYAGLETIILGAPVAGRRQLEEARALGQTLGDQRVVAWAAYWLGSFACEGGDHAEAQPLLEESVALYRAVGDPWGSAEAAIKLGRSLASDGDHERARALLEEGLAIAPRTGDRRSLGTALEVVGELAWSVGDVWEAGVAWEESLATYQELGSVGGIATVHTLLGHLALHDEDYGCARRHYAAALQYHSVGLLAQRAVQVLGGLSLVAAAEGKAERCLRLAAAGTALAAATGVRSPFLDAQMLDGAVQAARATLGRRAVAVWAAGRAMSRAQVVAYACDADAPLGENTGSSGRAAGVKAHTDRH
jgi:tetratricopeptide (TPR) repeat protein